MSLWSDDEILSGMQHPSHRQQAFRMLHRRYGARLLGFLVKRCGGDRELAEDLLGRSLYKAFLALPGMDPPCRSLSGWLYTVAARTALDELERLADDPLRGSLPLAEEVAEAREPAIPAAERPAESHEIDAAVEAVLARLDSEDPRYRTLLEMEHVGACDRGEIAEATGIARKQLSQYLKRARERFARIAREYPVLAALEQADVGLDTKGDRKGKAAGGAG